MLLQGGDEGQAAAGPPTPAVAAGPSGSGVAAVAAHRAQVARGKQPVSAGRSGDTASNTAVQVGCVGCLQTVTGPHAAGLLLS